MHDVFGVVSFLVAVHPVAAEVLVVVLLLVALVSVAFSAWVYVLRLRKARDKAVILRRVAGLEEHRRSPETAGAVSRRPDA